MQRYLLQNLWRQLVLVQGRLLGLAKPLQSLKYPSYTEEAKTNRISEQLHSLKYNMIILWGSDTT